MPSLCPEFQRLLLSYLTTIDFLIAASYGIDTNYLVGMSGGRGGYGQTLGMMKFQLKRHTMYILVVSRPGPEPNPNPATRTRGTGPKLKPIDVVDSLIPHPERWGRLCLDLRKLRQCQAYARLWVCETCATCDRNQVHIK
jgi:hypothetical protein